jgi:hypothetical protein
VRDQTGPSNIRPDAPDTPPGGSIFRQAGGAGGSGNGQHTPLTTLTEYLVARDHKARLERDLKTVRETLDGLERRLLDEFAAEGVRQKTDAQTGTTVWITRKVWARALADRTLTAEALRAHGGDLAEFARLDFNVNSLSAYFRELAQQRADAHDPVLDLTELVPADLRPFIALTDDHALSARKGTA